MKNSKHLFYCQSIAFASVFAFAAAANAATTQISSNVYEVTEGVAFDVGNIGASDFTFTWTDPGETSAAATGVQDVTLNLTAGETYTFQRTSSAHPFVIMDARAASFMDGSDGSYSRTTTSGAAIDNATLKPIVDFRAEPAPTSDLISWTPTQTGDYWYTCRVATHTGMAGKISVVPEPASAALLLGGVAALTLLRRPRRS
jgi:PEP-CTERM putative exosortase interaction domain